MTTPLPRRTIIARHSESCHIVLTVHLTIATKIIAVCIQRLNYIDCAGSRDISIVEYSSVNIGRSLLLFAHSSLKQIVYLCPGKMAFKVSVFVAFNNMVNSGNFAPGSCDQRVCMYVSLSVLSVCLLAFLKNRTSEFDQIFCTRYLWPGLGPPLTNCESL